MTGLLIAGAADWELEPLIEALSGRREQREEIWTFWEGSIGEQRVVVARTDWGPINAVAATLCGIRRFRPSAVISQGMAGAHDPDLAVGDVVVGMLAMDTSAYKSEPAGAGSGVSLARRMPLYHRFRRAGAELEEHRGFAGDEQLAAQMLAVPNPHGRVLSGTVGSAYQYNREIDCISALRRLYGSDCEDMESAFAAGAAAVMEVPFLAVRMISNSEWSHPELERRAGAWCAEFIVEGVRRGLRPSAPARPAGATGTSLPSPA